MTFQWPDALWLLLAVPALVGAYLLVLRRRRKAALRYASLAMVKEAAGAGGRWRRHVPPLLFLLSITAMLLAISRPAAIVSVPSRNETILLAMDVSGSMRAKDVEPNRLEAAQAAARAFVGGLPPHVRVGVIAFAATASVVQAPTRNREDVMAAIDRFQLQRGTAIGSGIVVSLATLFPDAGYDVGSFLKGGDGVRNPRRGAPMDGAGKAEKKATEPVEPGSYDSAVIVVVTDGQRTSGPDPLKAAKMAADRGVRVYTVGIGTPRGETVSFEGWSMRVRLDEETLKSIANATRGEYFYAGTASDLRKIYEDLRTQLVFEKKEMEVTALVAAAAGLLALLSGLLSLLWFNRIL